MEVQRDMNYDSIEKGFAKYAQDAPTAKDSDKDSGVSPPSATWKSAYRGYHFYS